MSGLCFFFVDFSHQGTGAGIMSMRFGSGELLDEFDGYLTAVSENSPCKSDWLGGVLWTAFSG